MHAVILAAGVGDRLGGESGGQPKCLLEMKGRTLLARHVDALRSLGISAISVVTGFQRAQVESELSSMNGAAGIHTVFNPDYRHGSIVSLWSARAILDAGQPVLLMDADVLYHPDILRALVASRHANCLLIDREFEPGEEPVKVCISAGRIIEFRKQVAPEISFDLQGESVGFFRFDSAMAATLGRRAHEYISEGRSQEPYEEAIRDLLLERPGEFGYEDVTGLPWIEIDFPADLARARGEVMERLAGIVN
ncbi:MAG: NTP transferase domain-containing protein [Gammaproteobacteria bacterium]